MDHPGGSYRVEMSYRRSLDSSTLAPPLISSPGHRTLPCEYRLLPTSPATARSSRPGGESDTPGGSYGGWGSRGVVRSHPGSVAPSPGPTPGGGTPHDVLPQVTIYNSHNTRWVEGGWHFVCFCPIGKITFYYPPEATTGLYLCFFLYYYYCLYME